MRKVPFLETTCPRCGKHIYLWDEADFFATTKEKKKSCFDGDFDFWYTCPECGMFEKHPECFLPTYLKENLINDLLKKKS